MATLNPDPDTDSQNGVLEGKKLRDIKFKRSFYLLMKAFWFLLEPESLYQKPESGSVPY